MGFAAWVPTGMGKGELAHLEKLKSVRPIV